MDGKLGLRADPLAADLEVAPALRVADYFYDRLFLRRIILLWHLIGCFKEQGSSIHQIQLQCLCYFAIDPSLLRIYIHPRRESCIVSHSFSSPTIQHLARKLHPLVIQTLKEMSGAQMNSVSILGDCRSHISPLFRSRLIQ